MLKACQCGIVNDKVLVDLHKTSIKLTQVNFQNCIMHNQRKLARVPKVDKGVFGCKATTIKIDHFFETN
jgi:hypothetical protein